MTIFCSFTHAGSDSESCFFGLDDKISAVTHTHNASTTAVTSTQEFAFPDTQGSSLISLALSSDNLYLVGVYSNKAVVCWDLQTTAIVGQNVVHKKPTALVCSTMRAPTPSAPSFALVADKGGEVWAYPLPSLASTCKLLGHTSSVITDMVMSPDGCSIVTADRDEKIRLTSFPQTTTIHGYCLGHTDVVTSTAFLCPRGCSSPLLVSAGWDHRLCLWDTQRCSVLDVLALAPVQEQQKQVAAEEKEGEEDESAEKVYDETKAGHFPLRVVPQPGGDTFAVLFWNKPEMHLYQVEQGESGAQLVKKGNEVAVTVIALPAAPVDCVFVDGGLLALLPSPHHWQALSLSGEPAADGCWTSIARHFSDIAAERGSELKQRLVFTDDSLQEMKKHSLDRPYAHAAKKGKKNPTKSTGGEGS
mmetsp:Transcript_2508/g.4555  ORF Transcript_2508/g.4555 Transcript_2508/m.4555 type:complete len:417 (-) Transcript_2508:88-1338(-)